MTVTEFAMYLAHFNRIDHELSQVHGTNSVHYNLLCTISIITSLGRDSEVDNELLIVIILYKNANSSNHPALL